MRTRTVAVTIVLLLVVPASVWAWMRYAKASRVQKVKDLQAQIRDGGKQMTDMMPATNLFNETGYSGVGFGLGFGVTVDVAATRIPGTVGEYAWGGAASTVFFVDPKEDMVVVFMTQVLGAPDRVRLRRDLRTLVYSAMTE